MSQVLTANEARQIMDFLQAMDEKLDIHITRTEEQFKTLRAEIKAEISELRTEMKTEMSELQAEINDVKGEVKAVNEKVEALRSELREDVNELRIQQRATDSRLWAFVVGLVTLVGGGVTRCCGLTEAENGYFQM